MDDIKSLFGFLSDFPKASAFLIALGIVLSFFVRWLTTKALLYFHHIAPGLYSTLMETPRRLCKYGAFWLYYRSAGDAVILRHIDDCKDYLRLHFAEGKPGEIWLFKNDLRAFTDKQAFEDLYESIVFKLQNVLRVLILLEDRKVSYVPKRDWAEVATNLKSLEGDSHKVFYAFLEEINQKVLKDEHFQNFVSDESFCFYTHGKKLVGSETVCVHRRFVGEPHQPKDVRIILMAKRHNNPSEPLNKFLPQGLQTSFEQLFVNNSIDWKPLQVLATQRAA